MTKRSTTQILKELRLLMKNTAHVPHPLQAYIVPSEDAHQSEYIAKCDERRQYVTGFTGSYGTAIITEMKAALWTDGRYHIQAEKELDDNWFLMKQGLPDTPSEAKWLSKELAVGSYVGVDPYLYNASSWDEFSRELTSYGHSLVPVSENLVDLIWHDRPPPPMNVVYPLEIQFTGRSLSDKINDIRDKLEEEKASALLVTALDEIAYLFNLRGSDIDYNPVFFSYAIVTINEVCLYIHKHKLTPAALHVLQDANVQILPYEQITKDLETLVMPMEEQKIWVSDKSSNALSSIIPPTMKVSKQSPVALMKGIKNTIEREGMRACHVRDGVSLCRYLCWLERVVSKGEQTEISAATMLRKFREEQDYYVGLSFTTISSVGPNAAITHYSPSPESDRRITTEEIYLVDSGAQYKDGTTDVTRTVHFGTPSKFEKESFTRVLKGHIALASCIFPSKLKGSRLDVLARKPLWDVGLDYGHGTGHGIGMFLNVHEGPMAVTWRAIRDESGLEEGMFISNEPGYYEEGKFGIRIENIVEVVQAKTPHNFESKGFLTFNTITLAPIQAKLISPSMLTSQELEWLNSYHGQVLEVVGSVLLEQGHKETYNWLAKQTQPIG